MPPSPAQRQPVSSELLRLARRMGPLPCSALGTAPAPSLPPGVAGWLAAALDRCWDGLGRPDPLVVVDAGAGDASRAAAVLDAGPRCLPALRWLLVDGEAGIDARQRATLAGRVAGPPLEDPALVLGPVLAGPDPDEAPAPPAGIGPLIASLPDLPAGLPVAVVVAVGWMSRLPADRFEWHGGRWWEVRLAAPAAGDDGGHLEELLVEARQGALEGATGGEGARVGEPVAARRWLAAARRVALGGRVLALDLFSPESLPLDRLPPRWRPAGEVPPLLAVEWDMLS